MLQREVADRFKISSALVSKLVMEASRTPEK